MIYIIHFETPYHHARHYMGWVESEAELDYRLWKHKHGRGAVLMRVVTEAGIKWHLSQTLPGDRTEERRLKRCGGGIRFCPECNSHVDPLKEVRHRKVKRFPNVRYQSPPKQGCSN